MVHVRSSLTTGTNIMETISNIAISKDTKDTKFPVIVTFLDNSYLKVDSPEKLPMNIPFKIVKVDVSLNMWEAWTDGHSIGQAAGMAKTR
jgi:hypothetical protein